MGTPQNSIDGTTNDEATRPAGKSNALSPADLEKQLGGYPIFKFVEPYLKILRKYPADPKRKFLPVHHVTYLLFYFFNPILTSMRGILQASELPGVRRKLNTPRVSLGAFSEASAERVFDAKLLANIFRDLASKAPTLPDAKESGLSKIKGTLTAVDGTLLRALPRMVWALWQDDTHRAAKAHVLFEVQKGIPCRAEVTAGNGCEKDALEGMLEAERCYILDRGYVRYSLYQSIIDAGSSFVVRVRNKPVFDVIEERELTDEDRAAGVLSDRVVRLGCASARDGLRQAVRLVTVRQKDGSPMVLCTSLMDIAASLVGLIYKHRWTVELFFRWLKRILGCRHLLSEKENGVALQVYAALIASVLMVLWTGRKPTKRTFELICLHTSGWATVEDIERHMEKLARKETGLNIEKKPRTA